MNLFDYAKALMFAEAKRLGFPQKPDEPKLIDLTKRRYDIDVDYVSAAPYDERFVAIDLNSYDGASEGGVSACIGRGASRSEAIRDLVTQIAACELDPAPKPRAGRLVNSSPFEPPEYVDDADVDFDDELESEP